MSFIEENGEYFDDYGDFNQFKYEKEVEEYINKILNDFCDEFGLSFIKTTDVAEQLKDLLI